MDVGETFYLTDMIIMIWCDMSPKKSKELIDCVFFQILFYTSSHNHGSQKMGPSNSSYLSNIAIFPTSIIMGERIDFLTMA